MPSWRRAPWAPLCIGVLAACSGSGSRTALTRFPLGIYGIADPKLLSAVSDSGFDSFFAEAQDAEDSRRLALEAERLGMRMLKRPYARQDQSSRAGDSDHPQIVVATEGLGARQFSADDDALLLDWRPGPRLKPDYLADEIDTAYKFLPSGKPLWMVVQAFDREETARPRTSRVPDHAEMRFMSWLSIVHGAKGLFYFKGGTLLEEPELWQAVSRVSREIKSFQPILEGGRPIAGPLPPAADGLEAKAWRYRGRDYVVIVNRSPSATAKLPREFLQPEWRALFELRRDPKDVLESDGPSGRLRPYQVIILESDLRWWSSV